MLAPDRVFRIFFRLRTAEYELISVAPDAHQAGDNLVAQAAQIELVRVEDLGLRSEMDDAEFERLLDEVKGTNL